MFVLLRHLRHVRKQVKLIRTDRVGSLALRHVDAGSCNGCEHELNATSSPYYDMARYGLSVVASPRHADVLLITGSITTRMVAPLRAAYEAMPEPRLVAALGNCALGHNVIGDPAELVGNLEDILPVTVRIPGCPPTPEQIIDVLRPLLTSTSNRG